MNYDREILYILGEAGYKGLSVRKIARHVFNNNNSFFDNVSFDDVYRYVSSYLKRNSKSRESVVEKTEVRGVYRINMSSVMFRQLQFDFREDVPDAGSENKEIEDRSLSLF